jgi:hypothetical protein
MKLNSAQIERTLHQFHAEAIPADHPLVPQLTRMFGDHTYFLDSEGLNIVEPAEVGPQEGDLGVVVSVADWFDGNATQLVPHEPEMTDLVVALGESRPH